MLQISIRFSLLLSQSFQPVFLQTHSHLSFTASIALQVNLQVINAYAREGRSDLAESCFLEMMHSRSMMGALAAEHQLGPVELDRWIPRVTNQCLVGAKSWWFTGLHSLVSC